MFLNFMFAKTSRKRPQSSRIDNHVIPLESRLLLSAKTSGHAYSIKASLQPQATTANFGGGFWSGFAQNETTLITQQGKKVEVSLSAPDNWGIATTPIQLTSTATGKGKVHGETIKFVLQAEARNSATLQTGTAKLTFQESLISPNQMAGTVTIKLAGLEYTANEFAVHYV